MTFVWTKVMVKMVWALELVSFIFVAATVLFFVPKDIRRSIWW